MKTHDVRQGSTEWLNLRDSHDTASEAPAMFGASKYMTRDQLLKQKHTGESEPVSPHLQVLFDKGHAAEAAIRPHIAELIGQELFPVTGSIEADGLNLLASFDGLSMDDTIVFEHKLWNAALAEQLKHGNLPSDHYLWQLDQQLYLSGASKAIFVTSDGTPDNMEYIMYESNPDRHAQLLNGWKQFNEDLANYVYTPEPELIKAEAVLSLPAVSIQVDGAIALTDNLSVFGEALKGYIGRINKEPKDDQDFANLELAVKTLKSAEEALTAAENGALAQAASIDTMRRTVALYRTMARDTRLASEKLVKTQKEIIRTSILHEARDALVKHVGLLNEGLGALYVQYNADFKAAMSGKKTVATLRSAANDELARAKIEANEAAEKYRGNLKSLNDLAADYMFLFNDVAAIIGKEPADFVLLVNDRVAKQKQVEADKLEADREKIRAEEVARIEEEQEQAEKDLLVETVVKTEPEPVPATQINQGSGSSRSFKPAAQPVYVVTVTDKRLFAQAVLDGLPNTDIDDLFINTDRLTEKAYKLNGNLSIPGIKVADEKEA